MNCIEAMKAAKEGKTIAHEGTEARLKRKVLFWVNGGLKVPITFDTLEGWEIVEEKKTLSDKIINKDSDKDRCIVSCRCWDRLEVKDVKEALKEFIDSITVPPFTKEFINTIAKEIFGKRLVE